MIMQLFKIIKKILVLSLSCFMLASCDNSASYDYQKDKNTTYQITDENNMICNSNDKYPNDLQYNYLPIITETGYASENGIIAHSIEDIDEDNDDMLISPLGVEN